MKQLKHCLLLGLALLFSQLLQGQNVVNFTADSTMKDAMVANGGVENSNFGSQNQIRAFYDLSSSVPKVFRTFIHYDLSAIPSNALITSATLKLIPHTVNNSANHPIYIERVADSNWYEDSIKWNNQPGAISSDQLSFSHAQTTNTSLQEFDVTNHVQKMVNYPNLNNGWRIRLQNESGSVSHGIAYYSSEATLSSNRPVLTVEYIMPIELSSEVIHATAGNSDGELSVSITGGSGYSLSNMYFYKTIRDTTSSGNATLSNVKTTYNLQYSAGTITAEDLDPGIYVLRVLDDEYYVASDTRYIFYKHILVGREGEITSGILMPNYQYQENTAIAYDKPANTSPTDRANTNYNNNSSSIALRVNDAPDLYENASLIKYEIDFDHQLEFSSAELHMKAWDRFFRHNNSNNAVNYTMVTSPWQERIVTWNTRPSVNSSYQMSVPTTTTIGFDNAHIRDTLSLLPFVEYWQENPTENYGFEIALSTYGAIQTAQRDYISTNANNNYIIFEFSVKPPVFATYDDTTNTGTLTVNAPNGTLPYTYLIHTAPIPTLVDIWNEFPDTSFIDSVEFFTGNVNSKTFTFNGLPSGKYYVAVFDNGGTKIMNGSGVVNTLIGLYDDAFLDLSEDNFLTRSSGATSSGTGRLYAELPDEAPFGGITLSIQTVGDFSIGFNKSSQSPASSSTDFEFGLKVASGGTYQVIEDNVALTSMGSLSANDVIDIYRDFGEYVIRINGSEIYRNVILNLSGENSSFDFLLNDVASAIRISNYVGKLAVPTVYAKIAYPECGSLYGDIILNPGIGVEIGYASLQNNYDATIISPSIVDGIYSFLDVPIGTYTLSTGYIVEPLGGFPYVSYPHQEQIAIGYKIIWENLYNTEEVSLGIGNYAIQPIVYQLISSTANSTNHARMDQYNWVQFTTSIGYLGIIGGERITLENGSNRKFGLNVSTYLGASNIKEPPLTFYPSNTKPINGVWRIEQEEGTFNLFYENTLEGTKDYGIDEINYIQISQNRNARYINMVSSFCNNYPIPEQFVEPKREIEGGYFLVPTDNLLRFEFFEEYTLGNDLKYFVRDYTGQVQTLDGQSEVYGDNRYILDVSTLDAGVYIMEIVNDKGENWFIRFKVQA